MSCESKRKKKMYMKEAGKRKQMKNKTERIRNEIGRRKHGRQRVI
jgi:hypothetical protein